MTISQRLRIVLAVGFFALPLFVALYSVPLWQTGIAYALAWVLWTCAFKDVKYSFSAAFFGLAMLISPPVFVIITHAIMGMKGMYDATKEAS